MHSNTDLQNIFERERDKISAFHLLCHNKIICLTLFLSILLHISFFINFSGLQNISENIVENSHSIELTLSKPIPNQPNKTVKNTAPNKHKPVGKSQSQSQKPVATNTQKPIEKPVTITEEKQIEEPVIDKTDADELAEIEHSTPTTNDHALLLSEKEEYMRALAEHLNKHKFYPQSARRRNIEGNIRISFDLLQDGNILNLRILSGHKVLQRATSESIKSALPMPPRPESLLALNTMKIEYAMQYAIK